MLAPLPRLAPEDLRDTLPPNRAGTAPREPLPGSPSEPSVERVAPAWQRPLRRATLIVVSLLAFLLSAAAVHTLLRSVSPAPVPHVDAARGQAAGRGESPRAAAASVDLADPSSPVAPHRGSESETANAPARAAPEAEPLSPAKASNVNRVPPTPARRAGSGAPASRGERTPESAPPKNVKPVSETMSTPPVEQAPAPQAPAAPHPEPSADPGPELFFPSRPRK